MNDEASREKRKAYQLAEGGKKQKFLGKKTKKNKNTAIIFVQHRITVVANEFIYVLNDKQ